MIAVLEFFFALLALPVLAVILMGADALNAIAKYPLAVFAFTCFAFAWFMWGHMVPDPDVPWNSLVDVIAQTTVFGIAIPRLAALMGILAAVDQVIRVNRRTPKSTWPN